MPNKRIFYASHAVGISGVVDGGGEGVGGSLIPGAQSVSINTNFNLEQIFQLGRLAIYDQVSTDPEVEVTVSKVLDGWPLIWNKATGDQTPCLVERANTNCSVILHVDDETQPHIDAPALVLVTMSGCYVNSLTYNFPVDGNFTEEVTFVGSNKQTSVGGGFDGDDFGDAANALNFGLPASPPVNFGDIKERVLRRQNMNLTNSVLPAAVSGQCITNISISANFNREKMFCLGSYAPFHRYVNFPLEITISFDVNPNGNGPSLIGNNFTENDVAPCSGSIITTEPILLRICDTVGGETAYTFNLGSGCSLQSVSYSGGDTGGGNVTETYTYITYNELCVTWHSDHIDYGP